MANLELIEISAETKDFGTFFLTITIVRVFALLVNLHLAVVNTISCVFFDLKKHTQNYSN